MYVEKEKLNILGTVLFAIIIICCCCVNYVEGQAIRYNIQGNKNLPVIISGSAFLTNNTKVDFSLEDLKSALANTPCSDCPKKDVFDKLVIAYKASNKKQKANIIATINYFAEMSSMGFCPGLPSTGDLKMVLK